MFSHCIFACVCVYVCICVCMCVCMWVHIYLQIHTCEEARGQSLCAPPSFFCLFIFWDRVTEPDSSGLARLVNQQVPWVLLPLPPWPWNYRHYHTNIFMSVPGNPSSGHHDWQQDSIPWVSPWPLFHLFLHSSLMWRCHTVTQQQGTCISPVLWGTFEPVHTLLLFPSWNISPRMLQHFVPVGFLDKEQQYGSQFHKQNPTGKGSNWLPLATVLRRMTCLQRLMFWTS